MAMAQEWTDRRLVEGARQRAILITIDYEGYGYREDGDLFRGRAVCVYAPSNFRFTERRGEIIQIDRQISRQLIEHGADPNRVRESEFDYMESELLRNSRERAASGPELALIPVYEYRNMERKIEEQGTKLRQEKAENLRLAEHNMIVRNDALRWKALATKLRLQRNKAQRSVFRKVLDRFRR
jgi:hypothetical protein